MLESLHLADNISIQIRIEDDVMYIRNGSLLKGFDKNTIDFVK